MTQCQTLLFNILVPTSYSSKVQIHIQSHVHEVQTQNYWSCFLLKERLAYQGTCLIWYLSFFVFGICLFSPALCLQCNKNHWLALLSLLIVLFQWGCISTNKHRCCNSPWWNIRKSISNCKWDAPCFLTVGCGGIMLLEWTSECQSHRW